MANCRNVSEALHWTRKFFGVIILVCLCVARQRCRKYCIRFQFGTIFSLFCEISCIGFSLHYLNTGCTEIQKISQCITAYGEKCICISSVCVWLDGRSRNYSILLKLGANFYVLYEISRITFGVHHPNNMYTGIIKIISMIFGLQIEILQFQF